MRLQALTVVIMSSILLAAPAKAETALQKHVNFFDQDLDRQITRSETQVGLEDLGIGSVSAFFMAGVINGALGMATGSPWYDAFTVLVDTIHQGKHGSNTGIYDKNGDYVQSAFDAIFDNYDADRNDELSEDEFESLYRGQYTDAAGSGASRAEFTILFDVAATERTRYETQTYGWGWWSYTHTSTVTYEVLTRETLQSFYDGTLFYVIAGKDLP